MTNVAKCVKSPAQRNTCLEIMLNRRTLGIELFKKNDFKLLNMVAISCLSTIYGRGVICWLYVGKS